MTLFRNRVIEDVIKVRSYIWGGVALISMISVPTKGDIWTQTVIDGEHHVRTADRLLQAEDPPAA